MNKSVSTFFFSFMMKFTTLISQKKERKIDSSQGGSKKSNKQVLEEGAHVNNIFNRWQITDGAPGLKPVKPGYAVNKQ